MKPRREPKNPKIVLVVARDFTTFKNVAEKRNDRVMVQPDMRGGFYTTEGKHYRYVDSVRDMLGHRRCEVEFWEGAEEREDIEYMKEQARIARQM